MSGKRTLVVGGSGMLRAVTEELASRGDQVTCVTRTETTLGSDGAARER